MSEKKVPADKLLQFKIDDGLETYPSLLYYKHFQTGRAEQVCFIANLAPRKLKNRQRARILSAENNDGSLAVIMPGRESETAGQRSKIIKLE